MGKLIIQFAVPAIILVVVAWYILKSWYLKVFPHHIQERNKIERASRQYDKSLK